MGNAALKTSRAVLREEVQLHFRSGQVGRDVEEVIRGWFEDGAPMGLTLTMFQRVFDLQAAHAEEYFKIFDTDQNKKVDAFEALCVLIVLAEGTWEAKVDTIFPVFDFSSSGRLNFDEANIMLQSICRGLSKVCKTPMVDDNTLLKVCRQMFDAHNIRYDDTISKEQFRRWLKTGSVEAAKFLDVFQNSCSFVDVEAQIAEREQNQAAVFSQVTASNQVSPEVILQSDLFRAAIEEPARGPPSQDELEALVAKMVTRGAAGPSVSLDRYVEVMHSWNVFNALDVLREGGLDHKELRNLLIFQYRQEPDEKTLERFGKILRGDAPPESTEPPKPITRDMWIQANVGLGSI